MEQKRGMCNLKKLSAFKRMKINALCLDQSSNQSFHSSLQSNYCATPNM